MRFPGCQRLRSQLDFQEVRNRGKSFKTRYFFLQLLVKDSPDPPLRRIGIITSRRVGNAVKRNRSKRLLREIFRENQGILPSCCDIVIVMRNTYDELSFQDLQDLYLKGIRYLARPDNTGQHKAKGLGNDSPE
jgi:ribonuclease P protein component